MNRIALLFCVVASTLTSPVLADVGDPTLRTDHPQYAGEGAFQEIEDCVQFATQGQSNPQDRAIAMYQWLLSHQWHLASPQEWNVPGRIPDTAQTRDYESVVYDANRGRFSYGYGLCGTVHAWNEPYWRALGMGTRRRAFPGHTNSEIQYQESWHAFDTDMAGLLFRRDGVVAGYEDVIADPSLVDSVSPPLPHYPFAWPADFDVMKRGWQQVAAGGNWFCMYNGGYAAHPGIVHLRHGETFTRWYDRDHFGGPSKRRFWHHHPGGPQRGWTFFDNGTPRHNGSDSNARGDASYCNGEFVYEPDFSDPSTLDGWNVSSGVTRTGQLSPKLLSKDGSQCSVTFRHFSPYVICGDPVDDANPMSAPATDGVVVESNLVGKVDVEISADEGLTWKRLDDVRSRMDLTEYFKGRYGWRIRFVFSGQSGIDSLKFTTTTQVCQAIYPRLKANGTEVTYRSTGRGVVAMLPDFTLDESRVSAFEATELRSSNVVYRGRSEKNRRAYETTNNRPGHVVFQVAAPNRLSEIRAAMRYQIRVPPPENCEYRLEVSTDGGSTWRSFARSDIPLDNEFSSGWIAGRTPIKEDVKKALVRFSMDAGGHRTGLIEAQLYGVYDTGTPQNVTVEYGWLESGETKHHRETIRSTEQSKTFRIDTGSDVADQFVRISAN